MRTEAGQTKDYTLVLNLLQAYNMFSMKKWVFVSFVNTLVLNLLLKNQWLLKNQASAHLQTPSMATEEPNSSNKPKHKPSPPTPNPFTFWFYFTISVSLITLIFITITSLTIKNDPKTWFLTLPTNLRTHYSNGRIIKVQTNPHSTPIEVFTIENGPVGSSQNVLFVHGFGCSSYVFSNVIKGLGKKGVRAVAIDLPGFGFSDKYETVSEMKVLGGFGKLAELYKEIKEKGVFWGFDQLVEQGYVNYDYAENEVRVSRVESLKVVELGPDEMGRVLRDVIETLGLESVDLVFHDSAFNLGANWVAKNLRFIRSVTLIDSAPNQGAFPLWVLKFPVVREFVSGFRFVFGKVIEGCCMKSGGGLDAESHRLLLKGRDGWKSVIGMGNKMNSSFDIAEWGKLYGVEKLPMQVIWSSGWSEEWVKLGREVANKLSHSNFVTHSGGRWPQVQIELLNHAHTLHHFSIVIMRITECAFIVCLRLVCFINVSM